MEEALDLQIVRGASSRPIRPRDQILAIDLRGRDPDDAFTQIPYIKEPSVRGAGWARASARDAVDNFLQSYFDHFEFQSIDTEQFRDYLEANLLPTQAGRGDQGRARRVGVRAGPAEERGAAAPLDAFDKV